MVTATTVATDRQGFLLQLHADLVGCDADWEWVLVVDGAHHRKLPAQIVADPRVQVLRAGRAIGAAAARNLGLGVAAGRYVTSADDDDRLPCGSLGVRLAAATRYQVPWTCGALADLDGDVVRGWQSPMPTGSAAPGDVWRSWGCPCQPFPIGPTTLLVRTDLLRRVGGWHGLPQAEDFGMALAVTGAAPGYVLDDVVYLYRRHGGQMTTHPRFDELESLVRNITFERGRLCADAGPAVPTQQVDRAPA